jgi:hypothetical protein
MTFTAGPLGEQLARNAGILEEATAIAVRHADCRALPLWPVVLVPANERAVVPLDAPTRAGFLAHLAGLLDDVFLGEPRDNAQPMSAEASDARAQAGDIAGVPADGALSSGMVAGACTVCRGECCTAGGTHAFLRPDSITRVRARLAESMPDDRRVIEALYAHHLPREHYDASCVFHDRSGCALPRDLRSNLCNRYQCGELAELEHTLRAAGADGAYLAAADDVRLRRMARVPEASAGEACHP